MTAPLRAEKRSFPVRETARPKPLPWLGKRLLALALASGSAGYAFHLFGTWPLGVVAILTPIIGWAALVLAMQRRFGVASQVRVVDYSAKTLSPHTMRAIANVAEQADIRRRFGL